MAVDRKYGKVDTTVVGIPDDEPVFIIRAQDKASIQALLAYAQCAQSVGASAEFIGDVMASVMRFDDWQKKGGGTKVPD